MNPTQQEALDPNTPPTRLWELAISYYNPELVDLLLVSTQPTKKIAVIKVLKESSRASLYTAKKWIDDAPCFINRRGVARESAAQLQQAITNAGGLLELKPKAIPGEHARLVAQNHAAPVELLWALGSCDNTEIRRAVLLHPLLPEPLLYLLGAEFPESFLENPAVQLQMLEDPEVFFRWPERVRVALLTLPDTSEMLLRRVILSGPSFLRKTALAHTRINADFLRELASHSDADLRAAVAAHPKTSAETLTQMSQDTSAAILSVIAQNPNTPLPLLRALSHERGAVRNRLAQNPAAPPELLLSLLSTGSEEILFSLRENPSISPAFLRELAQHPNAHVRRAAATHPNTGPGTLRALASDESPEVLSAIAQNPATSNETLELLASRGEQPLLESIATNPNAAGALMPRLLQLSPAPAMLMFYLAQNPALPEALCLQYLPGMDLGTRRILATSTKNPQILRPLSRDSAREIRVAVAQNPNTPQETLATLSSDPEEAVRLQAALRFQPIEWR